MKNLQTEIKKAYNHFFEELGIDKRTGELETKDKTLRFATYPYIGAEYLKSPKKILLVSYDIGQDESPDKVQSFEDRFVSVSDEDKGKHIAGCYITSLYYLKNEFKWEDKWTLANKYDTCEEALKAEKNEFNSINPLAYVAMTNYFKFVEIQREHRSGDSDRKNISKTNELELFMKEVEVMKPDLIILQGALFSRKKYITKRLKDTGIVVYQGFHPSNRNSTQPKRLLDTYREI